MKLAYLSTAYPPFLAQFAAARPELATLPFEVQRDAFETQAFGWAGAWGPALARLGHEVREVWLNHEPAQHAWAREHGLPADAALEDVALAQLREFAPDALWFDHHDATLLARARAACPSLRATLGWVGSALTDDPIWRAFDVVLSCAPESVETLRARGVRAEHLHHGFQERVLAKLGARAPRLALSFVGQIAADHPLHGHRQRVLERLLGEVDLAIFSPSGDAPTSGAATTIAKRAAFAAARALERLGMPRSTLRRVPLVGRAATWPAPPRAALPAPLRRALRPGRFGLELYRTLRDSRVTLNVHAGEATRFTSNMRLFEATGVGACLLTDAAGNLAELFEPGREVATFRTADECLEQARWLLAHDAEREAMALAGQRRCLAAHTFAHRAPRLDEVLRSVVG